MILRAEHLDRAEDPRRRRPTSMRRARRRPSTATKGRCASPNAGWRLPVDHGPRFALAVCRAEGPMHDLARMGEAQTAYEAARRGSRRRRRALPSLARTGRRSCACATTWWERPKMLAQAERRCDGTRPDRAARPDLPAAGQPAFPARRSRRLPARARAKCRARARGRIGGSRGCCARRPGRCRVSARPHAGAHTVTVGVRDAGAALTA